MKTNRASSFPSYTRFLFAALLALPASAAETAALHDVIDPSLAECEFAEPMLDRNTAGQPLQIAGKVHVQGLGVQVETTLFLAVNGGTRLTAQVGVDDASASPTAGVVFMVEADGQRLWQSAELHRGDAPVSVDVDLRGRQQLQLLAVETGRTLAQAHADWVGLQFTFEGTPPRSIPAPPHQEEALILTPKPAATPRLNGARVIGVRPGHPLLHPLAATGDRPMQFTATGLPPGLVLNPAAGRITGSVAIPGTHVVELSATNAWGTARQTLRIEVGERLALTPPLGWNSWNCWAEAVDQDKILRAARALGASGLADHGWNYINIDDTWQGRRDPPTLALQPNEKFPDMKGLANTMHVLGLKLGIYSTPWVTSYGRHAGGSAENPQGEWTKPAGRRPKNVSKVLPWAIGRHSFAMADARQWAAWGIDYLKYDWKPNEVPETAEMASALRVSGRDIVYSLSNSAPFEYAPDLSRLAHSWRITGDVEDSWNKILRVFFQERWHPYGGPGHWNDLDMLVVGQVGWGPELHPTKLTPNEQYTHVSLWSLLCSPLLVGCDLEQLDDFTLSLLTNDEVLEVNQDPRGEPAAQVVNDGRSQVWAKRMEDGSRAIGLFNLARTPGLVAIPWAQLGLARPQRVRDLWRQQELDVPPDGFAVELPRHGVKLIRVWPASP